MGFRSLSCRVRQSIVGVGNDGESASNAYFRKELSVTHLLDSSIMYTVMYTHQNLLGLAVDGCDQEWVIVP